MTKNHRPLAALSLVALVALTSGCGSSTPAPTSSNSATSHAQAVKFSECMRNNGVSAFPDPPATGALTIDGIANGSSLNTNSGAFTTAFSACKSLEPPGFMGQPPTAREIGARLKFAQCMRENGVPDFPDPTADGPLIDTTRIPSLAGKNPRSDPEFNAAISACHSFATAAGVVSQ